MFAVVKHMKHGNVSDYGVRCICIMIKGVMCRLALHSAAAWYYCNIVLPFSMQCWTAFYVVKNMCISPHAVGLAHAY